MEIATVLGASEGIGKAVVDALVKKNITTKILVRSIDEFKSLYPSTIKGNIEVFEGNLDNNQALAVACEYSDVIFPCFNASEGEMVKWIDKVSNIAVATQSRIVFPGNIQNFGSVPSDRNPITEEYAKNPHTQSGQLRIALEYRLARAANEGASLTILRFPQLYGEAILDLVISPVFRAAINNQTCRWFGDPYKKFDFLHVEQAGEAMVMAARSSKAADTELHVPGPSPIEPDEWLKKLYEIANSTVKQVYSITPKWQLYLASILKKDLREVIDRYYLFEEPILMDGSKFEKIVGPLPSKTHEMGIKQSLEWYKYWFEPFN